MNELENFKELLTLRNFSNSTISVYASYVNIVSESFGKLPSEITENDLLRGIGSYVNLIFVINMFSAFFISCNSFTLYAYFFEKVIPIIVLVINIRFKINNFIPA